MIATDAIEVCDEVFTHFKTVWEHDAQEATNNAYIPEIRWPSSDQTERLDQAKAWVRVSKQTLDQPQTSFGFNGNDKRRFTEQGLFYVQVFVPLKHADGFTVGQKLVKIAKSAFTFLPSNKVWFRSVVGRELPDEPTWRRWLVSVEYEFDEER